MSTFSQRHGLVPSQAIQLNDINTPLRNGIWDCINAFFDEYVLFRGRNILKEGNGKYWLKLIWAEFFHLPLDQQQEDSPRETYNFIRAYFFDKKTVWYSLYDFVEFMLRFNAPARNTFNFADELNYNLEARGSGYRIINRIVAPISNNNEIVEIEKACKPTNNILEPVSVHINSALELLADKTNPNYRKSMAESISAIEAVTKTITGISGTLSNGIEKITKELNLNTDLRDGLKKLYDYSNDAHGIRHSMKDMTQPEEEDARYFLVSCSAFVNYVIEKARKLGKLPK